MGLKGQHHATAALCPWEMAAGTHWIGGRVGLRAGLDTGGRGRKSYASAGNRSLVVQSVVRH
jgi:hypothetical protein